jgi:multidrug efflux system membrane fusion protein
VHAEIPNQQQPPSDGKLTFIDNAVDTATGTIKLKGTFANTDRHLWPGQFVNVVLTLRTQPNAIIVPSAAVQTGQQGQYVWIVKPDNTAESRPVMVSRSFDGQSVIEKGLQPGEQVVTDGQSRLGPSSKVEIKSTANAAPSGNVGPKAPTQGSGS